MDFKELKLMKEEDPYSELVSNGQPVAVFKVRKNADGTFSNFVEMFNCSDEQVAFVQGILDIRRAGGCHA